MASIIKLVSFDNPWLITVAIAVILLFRLEVATGRSWRKHRAVTLEYVDAAVVAVILVFCILRPFVVQAFYIPSGSMLETLQINDRILVNKFIYFFRDPKPGEVVVFDAPEQASPNEKRDFIKRVVGVGGDTIAIRDHHLYRNGRLVDEPYLREPMNDVVWPEPGVTKVLLRPHTPAVELVQNGVLHIPPGYLMVCGDNRNDSNDSRRWEAADTDGILRHCPFLPRDGVLGKAMCIFFPPQRLGLVRAHPGGAPGPAPAVGPGMAAAHG